MLWSSTEHNGTARDGVRYGRDSVRDGRLGRLASLAALAYREGRDGTGVRAGRDVMVRCGL